MSYYLLSFSKLLVELLISRQDSLLKLRRVYCENSWQAAAFKNLLVIVAILLVFDSFFPTPDDLTTFGWTEAFEALGFAKSFVSYWVVTAWHCTSFHNFLHFVRSFSTMSANTSKTQKAPKIANTMIVSL